MPLGGEPDYESEDVAKVSVSETRTKMCPQTSTRKNLKRSEEHMLCGGK